MKVIKRDDTKKERVYTLEIKGVVVEEGMFIGSMLHCDSVEGPETFLTFDMYPDTGRYKRIGELQEKGNLYTLLSDMGKHSVYTDSVSFIQDISSSRKEPFSVKCIVAYKLPNPKTRALEDESMVLSTLIFPKEAIFKTLKKQVGVVTDTTQ